MTKYAPLTDHLKARHQSAVPMRFKEIEQVLGFNLPPSSRQHRAWWSNNPSNNVMTKAWLEAGYQTRDVDLASEKLVFEKLNTVHAPVSPAQVAQNLQGDHPLFGCAAGTITLAPGIDLTDPGYTETELDDFADRKVSLLQGKVDG